MDADALISIVVPTHNRERYLREAVESVFRQSYHNWQLVVVDDGSTDGTAQYLSSVRHPRVQRIFRARRSGAAAARNAGLRAATGTYVAFLDDDDLWMPDKLQRQMADFRAKPGCRWGYTFFRRIDGDGRDVPLPPGRRRHASEGWILEDLLRVVAWVATPAVVAERTLLGEVGGFDETLEYCEDFELWIRFARHSAAALVPEPLVAVRQHGGNMLRADEVAVRASWVQVYERLLEDPDLGVARRVCRRQWARASVYLADRLRGGARYAEARATLARSARPGCVMLPWWVSAVKTVIRPWVPSAVMRGYRSFGRRLARGRA